jgi:tetratricopeptide (TPR) repeat protein
MNVLILVTSRLKNRSMDQSYLKQYNQAITYFNKILAIDPNSKLALTSIADTLAKQGDYNQALAYYDKALAVDPRDITALISKGNTLADHGNYNEAIMYYDNALDIDRYNAYALNNKGYALYNLHDNNEAITTFHKVLAIHPNDAYAKQFLQKLEGTSSQEHTISNPRDASLPEPALPEPVQEIPEIPPTG